MTKDDTTTPKTILVIDDDPMIVEVVQSTLRKDGHTVHSAKDGLEGIWMAEDILPDLILMDIVMSGVDGYQATQKIKNKEKLKDIPVIFLSGQSASDDDGQAFASGADSFLRKPFTGQMLREMIRLVLEPA